MLAQGHGLVNHMKACVPKGYDDHMKDQILSIKEGQETHAETGRTNTGTFQKE